MPRRGHQLPALTRTVLNLRQSLKYFRSAGGSGRAVPRGARAGVTTLLPATIQRLLLAPCAELGRERNSGQTANACRG